MESLDRSEGAFERWFAEFGRLARERQLEWLVTAGAEPRRAAFDRGLSPDEELTALADMSEWRGCGCGGGG